MIQKKERIADLNWLAISTGVVCSSDLIELQLQMKNNPPGAPSDVVVIVDDGKVLQVKVAFWQQ